MSRHRKYAYLVVIVAMTGALAGQEQPVVPVVGRVIDGRTGLGIAGARVVVSSPETASRAPAAILTESNGDFTFTLHPGTRQWLTARLPGYSGGTFGQLLPGDAGQYFDVPADRGLALVTLRLWQTGAISGRVTDERGEPLVGAKVVATRRQFIGSYVVLGLAQTTKADDRGDYRFRGLEAGDYVVAVESPPDDGKHETYMTTYAPGLLASNQASVSTLKPGQELSGIDVAVNAAGQFSIAGRVSGFQTRHRPPQVELFYETNKSDVVSPLRGVLTTVSESGTFVFTGVSPGSYSLRVLDFPEPPPGGASQGALRFDLPSNGNVTALPDEPTYWCEKSVSVKNENIDVVLELRKASHIEGQVTIEDLGQRTTLLPFTGAVIMAVPSDGRSLGSRLIPMPPVGPNGEFRTAGFPPGSFDLALIENVRRPSTGYFVESVIVAGVRRRGARIDLADDDLRSVEIVLNNKTANLTGLVRDQQGRPVSSATVYLFPEDRLLWAEFGPSVQRIRATQPDSTGSYTITTIPPGEYLIVAVQGGAREDWRAMTRLTQWASQAVKTTVSGGRRQSVNLTVLSGGSTRSK